MYSNTGYLNHSDIEIEDNIHPLIIGSCGIYRMLTVPATKNCWFIRSFRLAMGMPPMQYITSVRLNRARMLLESTDYPIQEIGAMVGYDNPLYFSRIFKKQMGEPPSRYRKH